MGAPTIKFGTDGWRGVVGDDFTYENVRFVAQGIATYLSNDDRPVVVAHDARFSAELFAQEVSRVLAANKRRVLLINRVSPTPVACWTVVDRKAAGAVMVTASHNPAEFNGLKFRSSAGASAPPEVIAEIEKQTSSAIKTGVTELRFADGVDAGTITTIDPMPSYVAQLGTMVDIPRLKASGLRILHEAMYGAGVGVIEAVLAGGSTKVTQLHSERNPGFGGMHPEPIARYMPEAMKEMATGKYDLAIANDGDADRLGVVDETGTFVNQLQVAALFSMYLLEKKGMRGDIVRSLTSTNMVDKLAEIYGVKVHETPVGFPFIGKKMIETDAIFAAEESGGFAFKGHLPERDGLLAGLLIAEMIVEYGMPLSKIVAHLAEVVGPRSYSRHDIRFDRSGYAERKIAVYEQMAQSPLTEIGGSAVVKTRTDDGFKFYLDDGAWVLMRMSGTEPLMRIYSEAITPERVEQLLAGLEQHLGVTSQLSGAAH